MTSNKEFLDNLAATDPQALQAWFDAPRDAGEASIMSVNAFIAEHDAPRADCEQVDSGASDCSDTREQLERDIDYWLNSWTGASVPVSEIKQAVGQWLDRQAAITRAECDKPNWEYCETCDYERANERQARKIENVCAINAELQAQVDAMKSESSEFADGQDYWRDKCYELRDAINVLQKKQPYSYNPYKPLNTLNTIGRYIDELQDKVDNLAHDLRESERLREEMREELSIAYDHAHDLLARRDRRLA